MHRDHFVYAPNQWETTLHCNVTSDWLGAYTKWADLYILIPTSLDDGMVARVDEMN